MANRNTRIRGIQILDKGVDTAQIADSAVEALQINADAVTTVKILDNNVTLAKIADGTDAQMIICDASGYPTYAVVTGGDVHIDNAGLATIQATKVTDAMLNDDVATGLAGVGLSDTSGVMALDVNEVGEVVVDVANDSFCLTDNSDSDATKRDTIADLVTAIAGAGLTATAGVLAVDEHASGIITEDDIVRNEVVEPDTASDTDYTLANSPVVGTVNIYLNGLLQQPGTGEDYVIDGASVVFATAVDASDLVLADYIVT